MLVDTNVLVRHFTGQPRDQAQRASALLASATLLRLPSLIVAELAYVLGSVYGLRPDQVAVCIRSVLAHPPVQADEEATLLRTVELFESRGIGFADAYLAACAEASGLPIASFDRDFDRVATVERIEP